MLLQAGETANVKALRKEECAMFREESRELAGAWWTRRRQVR